MLWGTRKQLFRVHLQFKMSKDPTGGIESRSFSPGLNRRQFLGNVGGGIGAIALAKILSEENLLSASSSIGGSKADPFDRMVPHFKPKVKRVIYLFMHGGPSHVDLFDPKPDLIKYAGQPLPESFGSVMTRRKVAQNPLPRNWRRRSHPVWPEFGEGQPSDSAKAGER